MTRRMTLAAALAALLMAALSPAAAASAGPLYPPAEQGFGSLEEAVKAGVVEPELAQRLYKGEVVQTLAVLEVPQALEAYGDGNPTAVKRAQQLFYDAQNLVIKDLDLSVEQRFSLLPVLLTPLRDPEAALRLINHKLVVSLWVNGLNELWLTTSLPLVGQPLAMQGNLKGAGQTVAVLDTGADPAKPGLSRITTSFEAAPDDGQADSNGHGSGVAGVIAAAAPLAKIIPVDIMDGTVIRDSDTLRGLNWVLGRRYQENIVAVNMSWGKDNYFTGDCTTPTPYHAAFQAMRQARTMPIVAAGNHAFKTGKFVPGVAFPACVPGAIAVGGSYPSSNTTGDEVWPNCTDKAPSFVDTMTCSSGSGPRIDLVAPGANISTAGMTLNGTSAAAPHVAALSAILSSINPFATAQQIETQLKSSSVFVTDKRTSTDVYPRLSFPDAIRAAAPTPNDNRANATELTRWSGKITQTNWAATKEPGEADHAGNSGGASVWFRWHPDHDATVEFSTIGSDFNTLLSVFKVSGGTSVLLDDNDDAGANMAETSIVTVQVHAGETIEIAVDGYRYQGIAFPRTGHLRLNWNLPNDDIKDAMPFFAEGTSHFGSNIGATKQAGEQHHCSDIYSNASVWYQWSPPADNPATRLRASGPQILCVHVYETASTVTNPGFGQLNPIAWEVDDYGPPMVDFTFYAHLGKTYWIAVDGSSIETACFPNGQCNYATPTGAFTLQLG